MSIFKISSIKYNIINEDNKPLYKKGFDYMSDFVDGLAFVRNGSMFNIVDESGVLLYEEWISDRHEFRRFFENKSDEQRRQRSSKTNADTDFDFTTLKHNLRNEQIDDKTIEHVIQQINDLHDYLGNIDLNNSDYCNLLKAIKCASFLKEKFSDEYKMSVMKKTLIYRDDDICIFKPTNFEESRIIGDPQWCVAFKKYCWDNHYKFDSEAIYYVYDVMKYGKDDDFVSIVVRLDGSVCVYNKKHKFLEGTDGIKYIKRFGKGASVLLTKKRKPIQTL